MSVVCPQCGTPAKGTDKFCNSCGFLLQQPGAAQPPPPAAPQQGFPGPYGYGAPAGGDQGYPQQQQQQPFGGQPAYPQAQPAYPQAQPPAPGYGAQPPFGGAPAYPQQQQQQPAFGSPPPFGQPQQQQQVPYGQPPAPYGHAPTAVCAQGHEIPPGASYCPMGHPIAVQGPPQDAYQGGGFAPQPGFNAPPPQPFGQAPAPQPFGQPAQAQAPAAGPPPGLAATETPPPVLGPQALRGFLVSYQTNNNGDFWPLKGGRVVVGRAQSVDGLEIPLPDATISSRHAALVVDGAAGTVAVEDTGSTNGTYVNEEHIGLNGKRELHDGDKVRFGGYTTIVKILSRV